MLFNNLVDAKNIMGSVTKLLPLVPKGIFVLVQLLDELELSYFTASHIILPATDIYS